MKKNHLIKILSSLIVKSSTSQELLQVKFINCYLREYISFTTKMTLETWASLGLWVGEKMVDNLCNNTQKSLAFANVWCLLLMTFANTMDQDKAKA